MLKEKEWFYEVDTDSSFFTCDGFVKPDGYERLIANTIEGHLPNFNSDVPYLMEHYGQAWAFLTMDIHVFNPVQAGDSLIAHTYYVGNKRTLFGREIIFYRKDENAENKVGEKLFGAITYSALIDVNERKMLTKDDAATHIPLVEEVPVIKARPRLKVGKYDFDQCETLKVRPSWIDAIGHVNNSKYGEVILDNMSREARTHLGELKEFELNFAEELKEGDEFTVYRNAEPDFMSEDPKEIVFKVEKTEGGDAFSARLTF